MKKIRCAVIGVGRLGREHARIYSGLHNVELAGIVDTDTKRAGEVSSEFKTQAYELKDILGRIDIASIAVPTDRHFEVAKQLLNAGVHVLIEKPITNSISQADKLIKLAEEKKLLLQVGHVERFNPIIMDLAEKVIDPKFIEIHRLSPFTPRGTEVGVVLDLMIHDIDIILYLVRDKIKSIDGVGVNVLTPYEDIANARIAFQNGCVANITASRVSPERMRKIRVFQPNSYISLDYYKQEGKCFYKIDNNIVQKDLIVGKQEPLKLEIESFVDCVLAGRRPVVSGEDALLSIKVAKKISDRIWK